jgi:large subunit ribosomal protein L5
MATNKETARLREFYKNTVAPALQKEYSYKNVMEIPKIDKIVVCMGLGQVKDNSKSFNIAVDELTAIAGQKALPTVAKKAISNFKVREGHKIGAKVTLRGDRMYEFLDRLISIALPRVRDFKGVSPKSFDGRGNYAMGIKEQLIFPEIEYDKLDKIRGLDVMIVTSAKSDDEARALLKAMGMPFRAR